MFAWFRTSAQANLSTDSAETQTVSAVSNIEDALNLKITFTISISGNAVMVDDKGHEKIWMNGTTLKDLDETVEQRTARSSVVRYYTVTVKATGFDGDATDEQKAAALGATYSVTPTLTGTRFVAHGALSEMALETAGWWTAGIIPTISDIAVTHNGSAYSVSSSVATFYVVAKGGDDSQKDFTGSTNHDNITASVGLGTIAKNN